METIEIDDHWYRYVQYVLKSLCLRFPPLGATKILPMQKFGRPFHIRIRQINLCSPEEQVNYAPVVVDSQLLQEGTTDLKGMEGETWP